MRRWLTRCASRCRVGASSVLPPPGWRIEGTLTAQDYIEGLPADVSRLRMALDAQARLEQTRLGVVVHTRSPTASPVANGPSVGVRVMLDVVPTLDRGADFQLHGRAPARRAPSTSSRPVSPLQLRS